MSETPATDYWRNDLLGRKADAELIYTFLTRRVDERKAQGRTASYVLNLDGGWGHGKTFFLNGLKQLLEEKGHVAVAINAWQDDYAADPLLAIVSAIEQATPSGKTGKAATSLARLVANLSVVGVKHVAKAAASRLTGADGAQQLGQVANLLAQGAVGAANEILDQTAETAGKALLKTFRDSKETAEQFRKALSDLVDHKEIKKPIFILIDELDRCRPSYAVSLLERVKHLFEVDGVIFIVATDTDQLRHSISAVYGSQFDGTGYLLRFFDRTYRFPRMNPSAYIRKLFHESQLDSTRMSSPPNDDHVDFLSGMSQLFGLSLREIERCFDILRSFTTMWSPRGWKIQLIQLFPLIVCSCRNKWHALDQLNRCRIPPATLQELTSGGFNIKFSERDSYGAPSRPKATSALDLINQFHATARKPGKEILENRSADPASAWIQRQFLDEFQNKNLGRKSSIKEYGELVRRVAPLSDLQEAGEVEAAPLDEDD